jgi:hypothetical protein
MVEDFVWRQFLWFCLRNGLWYGATGGIETSPERWVQDHPKNWDRISIGDEKKDSLMQQGQEELDEAQTFQNGTLENTNIKSPVVVVSTLERIHRLRQ